VATLRNRDPLEVIHSPDSDLTKNPLVSKNHPPRDSLNSLCFQPGVDADVTIQAAQDFFASEWADARKELAFTFSPGTNITEICPDQDRATLLGLIRPYVTKLSTDSSPDGGW